MIRQVFVLLCAVLLAIQVNSTKIKSLRTRLANVQPFNATDDAQDSLDALRDIVQAAIFTADDNLGSLETDFAAYGDNILETGGLDIEEEHQTITGEITVLKDLGFTAGVDVSSCTDIREQVINRLPDEYKGRITDCIINTSADVTRLIRDSRYFVDVYINRVDIYGFQLGLCTTGSEACLTPIVNQINLSMIQLPQDIRVEVDRASNNIDSLKVNTQDCSDTRVAEYAGDANAILRDITACVNRLLG